MAEAAQRLYQVHRVALQGEVDEDRHVRCPRDGLLIHRQEVRGDIDHVFAPEHHGGRLADEVEIRLHQRGAQRQPLDHRVAGHRCAGRGDIRQRRIVLVDALTLGGHQADIRVVSETLDHALHAFEVEQVIVVEELDELTAGLLEAEQVVEAADVLARIRVAHITDARVELAVLGGDLFDGIGRAVVADQDFQVAVGLVQRAFQSLVQVRGSVGRHDDADQRLVASGQLAQWFAELQDQLPRRVGLQAAEGRVAARAWRGVRQRLQADHLADSRQFRFVVGPRLLAQGVVEALSAADARGRWIGPVAEVIVDQRLEVSGDQADHPTRLQHPAAFVQQANALVAAQALKQVSTVDTRNRAALPRQRLALFQVQVGAWCVQVDIEKALALVIGATEVQVDRVHSYRFEFGRGVQGPGPRCCFHGKAVITVSAARAGS